MGESSRSDLLLNVGENNSISDYYINTLNYIDENEDINLDFITKTVNETKAVFSQVSDSINLKLDAQLLVGLAESLKKFIEKNPLNDVHRYVPREWFGSMTTHFDITDNILEEAFWDNLGTCVHDCFSIVPSFKFMYGTDILSKHVTERQHRPSTSLPGPSTSSQLMPVLKCRRVASADYKGDRDKTGMAPTRPKIGDTEGKGDDINQNAVDALFDELTIEWKAHNKIPLSFWSLVLDPVSFENTVLNIFHASFLLKDGFLQVYYSQEEGGHPMVYPIPPSILKSKRQGNKDHLFTFLEINKEQWSNMKNIVKPFTTRT